MDPQQQLDPVMPGSSVGGKTDVEFDNKDLSNSENSVNYLKDSLIIKVNSMDMSQDMDINTQTLCERDSSQLVSSEKCMNNIEESVSDLKPSSAVNILGLSADDKSVTVNNCDLIRLKEKELPCEKLDETLIIESDEEMKQDDDPKESDKDASSERNDSDDLKTDQSFGEVSQASTVDIRDLGLLSQDTDENDLVAERNMPHSPEDLFASQSSSGIVSKPENNSMEYDDFIPSSLSLQEVRKVTDNESPENISNLRKRKLEEIDEVCSESKVPKIQSVDVLGKGDEECSKVENECPENEIASKHLIENDTVSSIVNLNGEKCIDETSGIFKEPKALIKENCILSAEHPKPSVTSKDTRKSVEIVFSSMENLNSKGTLNECSQDILDTVPEENGEDLFDDSQPEMHLRFSVSPSQATQSFSEIDISKEEDDINIQKISSPTYSTQGSSNGHSHLNNSCSDDKKADSEEKQNNNDSTTTHENSDIEIISPEAKKSVPVESGFNASGNSISCKSVSEATDDIVILDEDNDSFPTAAVLEHKNMNGSMVTHCNSGKQSHCGEGKTKEMDRDTIKHLQSLNLPLNDRSTPDLPVLLQNKGGFQSTPYDTSGLTPLSESSVSEPMSVSATKIKYLEDNSTLLLREVDISIPSILKCRVQVTEELQQVHSIEVYQCKDVEYAASSNHQESSSGYVADESKNSSPSSVVSVGPFPLKLPSWRLSTSSSSTASSGLSGIGPKSRSSDWNFVAPLKPPPSRVLRNRNIFCSSEFERDLFDLVEKKISDSAKLPSSKNVLQEIVPNISSHSPPITSHNTSSNISSNTPPVLEESGESTEDKIVSADPVPETPKSTKKLTRGVRNTRNAGRNLASKMKEVKEEELTPKHAVDKDSGEITGSSKKSRKTPARSSKRTGNTTPSSPALSEDTKSTSTGSVNRSRRNRTESVQNEKVDSSSQDSSHVFEWDAEGCFAKLVAEAPVFARWTDKRYYPGRIKEKTKDGRWIVEFDDKTVRPLKDEFIIPINILTKGQIVFANEEEEYEQGIIVEFKLKNDEVLYGVELDSGKKSFYPRSKLFMSEDQARLLQENIGPKSPTTSSPALTTLSCDNIVHHKRPRSNRVLFGAAETPSVSGVLKTPKRSGKGDPTHDTSCSSSVSDTNDKTTPLVLEEVTGVDPEVPSYFPESLPSSSGRGKGPGRIKSKTRTPRRNAANHSLNENQENNPLYDILGPIPKAGSDMFNGLFFLLTHSGFKLTSCSSLKSAKKLELSSGSEDVSADEGSTCKIPFVKDHLRRQIEAGGGIVFEHFEDLPGDQYHNSFLVADRPSVTAKYILCLASGIRIINHEWIIEEVKGSKRPWNCARLPAGWDLEDQRHVPCEATVRTRKQKPLNRKEIGLVNDSQAFVKFWGRILELMGAIVRHLTPEQDREFSEVAVIVTDSSCPPEVQERAREWSIPMVSPTWVTQSLISGKMRHFSGHPHYRYDYCASE